MPLFIINIRRAVVALRPEISVVSPYNAKEWTEVVADFVLTVCTTITKKIKKKKEKQKKIKINKKTFLTN